ncbi:MarR family winged helix-turn-helix transcriptional regulator [Thermomonospora umbrina]|uniref:DNA-binding MarR family transcriptional regulator n=1 Tax=Thermomonospora umbrina TaxID=111806 RepID=A0A3D9SJP6_9ACTN|nr:MarR family transcriptional regulator [Thermomonospora umbrina]REE95927.1 DNA-binding MarR family transcriptional regulator [Thermomonospora umbrina]
MDPRTWDQVLTLYARVEHELGRRLQGRHALGLSDYRALRRLAEADDGELRMQDLAERIGLNQSSVSRLAARLESAGLTRRDLCPDDRRGVYLVITDRGRTVQEAASHTYRETLDTTLDEAADSDLGTLIARLRG